MLLSALFLGCAASLAAGQTAPDPQLSTENGTLVLMSNEDVLIELFNGSASVGRRSPRFGLLETMSTMAADISSLRAELSAEVRRVERDAATNFSTMRFTTAVAADETSSAISTIRSTAVAASTNAATARAALSAQLMAALSVSASADNALFARVTGTTNTLSRAIATVAARPVTKMIGFQQCEVRASNGADSNSVIVMRCTFRKTRPDSFWVISHNSVMRQYRGWSTWQIEVDGRPCRDRSNNAKGNIDAAMYTAPNQDGHRPAYVRGVCYRTDQRSSITAGNHEVRWRQTRVSGDSYWGWNSNSRIMVEEWMP